MIFFRSLKNKLRNVRRICNVIISPSKNCKSRLCIRIWNENLVNLNIYPYNPKLITKIFLYEINKTTKLT